ncbi:glycosyltransferase [Oscillatoria sp. FACHB-1407]|uniref:glycosyltransferase family 4 protein n=1 Tax=Oscillatoria sp. FACHB-1407 TaxID=2692847 RepID=UPI0016888699|nr:glycosyltransferase family 4 protein [Oscillatoria sp. FACHB-1407]MBD2461605.1 glycosyltransferase [Oscillatoria sp. FACHB-1407]
MNILMLSSTFPYPPSRGGTEIRTFNLLKYLHQSHPVTVITQRHEDVSDADIEALQQYTSELVIFPLVTAPEQGGKLQRISGKVSRFLESWIKGTPPNVLHRYSPALQTWVDDRLRAGKFDVVTCEHSVNEIYIRPEFRRTVRTVVDVHSSVYAWTRNHLEMDASDHPFRDRLYLSLLKRYERRYCQKFTDIVVTTDDDRQELLRFNPNSQFAVIPNGVDLELFPLRSHDPGGHRLVFVGAMDASHNIDAARFFTLEVMPRLRQRYPDATFSIVGARPTPEIQAFGNQPGIIVTGKVASMVEQLHQATVCVVPLRTGFGIKNKTLEAMAAGVPVVGSDRGLEGLAVDGENTPLRALRANRVEEYIEAISRLFTDSELRSQLSREGRSLIESTYTWEAAGHAYEKVLTQAK